MNTPQQKPFKISLVGDDCIDEYHYGVVERISPEAPVPIFKFVKSISKPGMAANVLENFKALNCEVDFYTTTLSKKIRLIDQRSGHHITRIDYDPSSSDIEIDPDQINYDVDAIVISDYNKGTVTPELYKEIRKRFTKQIFVDTKHTDLSIFIHPATIVKINELEYRNRTGETFNLIVTQGSDDTILKSAGSIQTFKVPKVSVFDVCGAGDTFLAALVYSCLKDQNLFEAINFANKAAGITVQHLGVYAPTLKEIYAS
jgi:D-beta-D-heptose 7-phosphate kinase/D-beta-D-heptose 1-phosphate adenosyltransferase